MAKKVVLIVEDDVKLLQALHDFFINQNFEVLTAVDGQEALDVYFSYNHMIDIVLLDGMLPLVDGTEVLKTIREYSDVPIIMVTARESVEEQLDGLQSGADNYITKPFQLRVLKAHVDVLLRRKYYKEPETMVYGKLSIHKNAQKAYVEEMDLNLTPKEYALLEYFVENKNVVLSREVILNAIWGYDYQGDMRTVDTLVKQLRKKMTEECPYIRSVYGVGYRFGKE